MSKKESCFVPENLVEGSRHEHASPSGRYRLIVDRYRTGPGTWDYSQAIVYDGSRELDRIKRNYSTFPFLFIEGHPNGHDYLVCGEDYQGQTVLELDTGKLLSRMSEGSEKGFGFCWADYRFDEASKILTVDGCYWACPYEFRFFDFSDPMSGWSEIRIIDLEEGYVEDDPKWPVVSGDVVRVFQTGRDDDYEPTDDVVAWTDLKRVGNELHPVDRWVSDAELEIRRKRDEAIRAYDEWVKTFRSTDPLYLAMVESLKDSRFVPETYDSIGVIHDSWCPFYPKSDERRMHRRIHKDSTYTFDLEWGVDRGPVKLIIHEAGNRLPDEFFEEHSPKSIRDAFDSARRLMGSS